MPRRLSLAVSVAVVALGHGAHGEILKAPPADPVVPPVSPTVDTPSGEPETPPSSGPGEQGIGGDVGLVVGGRSTPGGVRIAGHYLYQLSSEDWFDGTASFTWGSGSADCFRDRANDVVCDHGFLAGRSVEVTAAVRRMFATQGDWLPFARAGIGLAIVRFSDDDVTGFALPLHIGGGVRVQVAPEVAIVAHAEFTLGIAAFGRSLGVEPQLGAGVLVGAEFRLP